MGYVAGLVGAGSEDSLADLEFGYFRAYGFYNANVVITDPAGVIGGGGNFAGASFVVAEVGAGGEGGDFGLDVELFGLERIERQ